MMFESQHQYVINHVIAHCVKYTVFLYHLVFLMLLTQIILMYLYFLIWTG